jgi:hypothetical protein
MNTAKTQTPRTDDRFDQLRFSDHEIGEDLRENVSFGMRDFSRTLELELQVARQDLRRAIAAKDAAFREVLYLLRTGATKEQMDFRLTDALSPDAGKGWLSPGEAEELRQQLADSITGERAEMAMREESIALAHAWREDAMRFYLFAGEIAEMAGTYPDPKLLVARWKQIADHLRAAHDALVAKEGGK